MRSPDRLLPREGEGDHRTQIRWWRGLPDACRSAIDGQTRTQAAQADELARSDLVERLRQRPCGLKFRRQHPAGPYVLDFFCSAAKLAIEVDGMSHNLDERIDSDAERTAWLADRGVETIRVSASDIAKAPDAVAEAIVSACDARIIPLHHPAVPDGPPPRSGEET